MKRVSPRTLFAMTVAVGFAATSAASAITLLDWSSVTWNPGDLTHTYTFGPPENVDVTITVSAAGSGSGTFTTWNGLGVDSFPCATVATPNKDGAPAPATYPSNRFGTKLDLGIVFDPGASNNRSVVIDIKFTNGGTGAAGPAKAVATFKFEISDIDWSRNGQDCVTGLAQGWRRDEVVITASNAATPVTGFSLTELTATPTFTKTTDTLTAVGMNATTGLESNGDDNGSVLVDFGGLFVTDVRLTYNEAAYDLNTNNNPGYRGIGILGVATLPVELIDFAIE